MSKMADLCTRLANYDGERVLVAREGKMHFWHARTESGELICKHQYRHDLQSFCDACGFKWEMLHE